MSNNNFTKAFAHDYSEDRLTQAFLAFDNLKWRIENMRDWLKLYEGEYNWQSDIDMENHIRMAHCHADDLVQALQDIIFILGWHDEGSILYAWEETEDDN